MLDGLAQAIEYAVHDRRRSWHSRHAPKEYLSAEGVIELVRNPESWPELLDGQTAFRRNLIASNRKNYPITFLPPALYALRYWVVMQLANYVKGLWTARIGAEHLCCQGQYSLFLGRTKKNMQVYRAWMDAQNSSYLLKLDVTSFFDSIPHVELCQSLRLSLGDSISADAALAIETLPLLLRYRYRDEGSEKIHVCKRGLPIGNTTERFFSNVYLKEIDDYLQSQSGITSCRKLDDMVVYGNEKSQLEEIRNEMTARLRALDLKTNEAKTKIFKVR